MQCVIRKIVTLLCVFFAQYANSTIVSEKVSITKPFGGQKMVLVQKKCIAPAQSRENNEISAICRDLLEARKENRVLGDYDKIVEYASKFTQKLLKSSEEIAELINDLDKKAGRSINSLISEYNLLKLRALSSIGKHPDRIFYLCCDIIKPVLENKEDIISDGLFMDGKDAGEKLSDARYQYMKCRNNYISKVVPLYLKSERSLIYDVFG